MGFEEVITDLWAWLIDHFGKPTEAKAPPEETVEVVPETPEEAYKGASPDYDPIVPATEQPYESLPEQIRKPESYVEDVQLQETAPQTPQSSEYWIDCHIMVVHDVGLAVWVVEGTTNKPMSSADIHVRYPDGIDRTLTNQTVSKLEDYNGHTRFFHVDDYLESHLGDYVIQRSALPREPSGTYEVWITGDGLESNHKFYVV